MATDISVRISRNPHGMPGARFEASFIWNGLLNRYQFDESDDLAYLMVKDKVHPEVRDEVMDALEKYEWVRTPPHFPLGVVYVGEAACDSPIDEPAVDPRWRQAIESNARCQFWKSLCGIAAFSCGLAVFSLFVVLSRK